MKNKALTTIFSSMAAFLLFSASLSASCVYEQAVKGENLQIGTMLTWSTSFEEKRLPKSVLI